MGRSLTPPPVGIGGGVFKLKAAAAIAQDDLLELGPNGKAYPVEVTDYAAVGNVVYGTAQTSTATGQIVAQTQVVAGQTLAYARQAVVQGDGGSIFTHTNSSNSGYGMMLTKYSAIGALVSQVQIEPGSLDTNHHILMLNNGNIAVIAGVSGASIFYAIYDQNLNVIKALTALSESQANAYFSACALSAGGFAVVYQLGSTPLLSRLVTYDNAGNVVLAPTTIWTRTGTSGAQYHRMAQLSNGNLVVAVRSDNTVSSMGLHHGIVTTGGASVRAFTSLNTFSGSVIPELSVMPGYYAVAETISQAQAFVFDNAGLLQGAGFNGGGTATPGNNTQKLLNDGTAFYLIWARSSDAKEVLTKLPVTGTGYVTTDITVTGAASNYSVPVDAFFDNGNIVAVSTNNGNAYYFLVFSTTLMALVSKSATTFGAGPGSTPGSYQRVIPGGDFSFICLYDHASTASTNLAVGKYANTAVMGVAQGAAAAEEFVATACIAGAYAANPIKGSYSKTFDHSATNIAGNKGTILNNGAVLKGF